MGSSTRHQRARRTALFLGVAVLANSFGNLLLAVGMERMPDFGKVGLAAYIMGLLHNPFVAPGAGLAALAMLLQLWLFSWADLSFVVPCGATSYVISTILAEFILGEQVHLVRWVGVLLIFLGVLLVARTPVATKPHGEAPAPEAGT